MTLSKEMLNELFEYKDGELYWRIRVNSRVPAGVKAGSTNSKGYTYIAILGKKYSLHRLIYLIHYGWLPKEVDHADTNPRNNYIENLRAATHSQNMHNAKLRKDNTSGIKGVSWHNATNKWCVRVWYQGVKKYFGTFEDIELAELVAIEARLRLHKGFARDA